MKKIDSKTLEKMIDQLKDAVKNGDNEAAHSMYDTIAFVIARSYRPRLMNIMDKIVGDMEFWCA